MLCPMDPPCPGHSGHSWEEGVWESGLSGLGLAMTSHLRGPQEGWWVPLAGSAVPRKRGSEMGTIRAGLQCGGLAPSSPLEATCMGRAGAQCAFDGGESWSRASPC